jgi:hypothetical protein
MVCSRNVGTDAWDNGAGALGRSSLDGADVSSRFSVGQGERNNHGIRWSTGIVLDGTDIPERSQTTRVWHNT